MNVVFENILSLRKEAKSLARRKNASLCAHVTIAAREETSKYLMLYCKQHLPPDIFKRRFQHLPKHKLSGAAYHISGQISVVHFIEVAGEIAGEHEAGQAIRRLSSAVMFLLDRGNPEKTAEVILTLIREHEDPRIELMRKQHAAEIERHRTTSIYVDVDDDLEVKSKPTDITMDIAKEYLDGLDVGIAALMFIRDPSMTTHQYSLLLPPTARRLFKGEINRFVRKWRRDFNV
nr:AbiV family abortive infection protein [Sinorhizobium meliloti]